MHGFGFYVKLDRMQCHAMICDQQWNSSQFSSIDYISLSSTNHNIRFFSELSALLPIAYFLEEPRHFWLINLAKALAFSE